MHLEERLANLRRLTLVVLGLALVAPVPLGASGKLPIDPNQPHFAKATSHLLQAQAAVRAGKGPAAVRAAMAGWTMRDDRPVVEIKLSTLTPELLDRLKESGLELESHSFEYARAYGRVDPARLGEITALHEVRVVRPTPRAGTRAGSVPSQGDATMKADIARTAVMKDGSGIVVGILSDSFNNTLGGTVSGGTCTCEMPGDTCATTVDGMANQTTDGSGDLPDSIPILDDGPGGLSDEGAALAELIFDSAPGASFLFHSAFSTPTNFAEGIDQLVDCGADIIVDDVFYTAQPFFQDGIIAAAAQDAVDAGVHYFSATGNDFTFGIYDDFKDIDEVDNMDETPNGDDLHDFGGGDAFAKIVIPAGCELNAELQWSEPFDGFGVGAASDLDLYLLSSAQNPASAANVLASSVSMTGCGMVPPGIGGDPLEIVIYENTTGMAQDTYLAIEHFCGDETVELRVINISFDCNLEDFDFENGFDGFDAMGDPILDATENPIFVDSQIFGHPAAEGVVAVAASFYGEIDSGGTLDPPSELLDVEPFSSLGGALPFFFDRTGMPLPTSATHGAGLRGVGRPGTRPHRDKEERDKPDITGPDGTNNTFFGTDIAFDADSDPNFFGTSAAAPNAAAIAALIDQLTDEKITPIGLKSVLQQTTWDMESPLFDYLSGFGFVDAHRATNVLDPGNPPEVENLSLDLEGYPFLSDVPDPLQMLQAQISLALIHGDFTGLYGKAPTISFWNGFEAGDSTWGYD